MLCCGCESSGLYIDGWDQCEEVAVVVCRCVRQRAGAELCGCGFKGTGAGESTDDSAAIQTKPLAQSRSSAPPAAACECARANQRTCTCVISRACRTGLSGSRSIAKWQRRSLERTCLQRSEDSSEFPPSSGPPPRQRQQGTTSPTPTISSTYRLGPPSPACPSAQVQARAPPPSSAAPTSAAAAEAFQTGCG